MKRSKNSESRTNGVGRWVHWSYMYGGGKKRDNVTSVVIIAADMYCSNVVLTGRPISDIRVVLAWWSTTCCGGCCCWLKSPDHGIFWTAAGRTIPPSSIFLPADRMLSISGPSADSNRSSCRYPSNSGSVLTPYRSMMYWSCGYIADDAVYYFK